MTEIAPCPWCEDGGKPFLSRNTLPFSSYTIKCHTCHAEGPHVRFDPNQRRKSWEEIVMQPRAEATKRWNEWHERIYGGDDEKSGENWEDYESPNATLAAVP